LNDQSKKPEPPSNLFLLSLGLTMAAGMAFFSFLGYFIDQKRGEGSLFTLLGMFLGLAYCFYEVWKVVRQDRSD
jgi:hypothetical protein